MKTKIHCGCGKDIKKDWINIDKEDYEQEIVRDFEKECLPFSDCSVDEIFSQHTLEHLSDPMFLIDEFWRVLKPNGVAVIIVPHKDNVRAYALRHKRYFNEHTFPVLETVVEKKWKILENVVNDRPDVYIRMMPVKFNREYGSDLELDLGCGKVKDRKAIGIDIDDYGQEIIWDIEKGIPFSDNSCRIIKAYSVLEHFDNLLYVMRECHRVLKKDGILDISVPYAGSDGSFRDPTHKNFWTENTFDYFCEDRPKHYEVNPKHKFKKIKVEEKNGGAIFAQLNPIK